MIDDELKRRQKQFGANLERIRKERGKSRKELAKAVGVNETSFGAYCVGRHYPSVDKLFTLAEILDCSIIDLISDNPDAKDRKIWEYRRKRAEEIITAANCKIEENERSISITSKQTAKSNHKLLKLLPRFSFHFEKIEDLIEVVEEIETLSVRKNIGFADLLEKIVVPVYSRINEKTDTLEIGLTEEDLEEDKKFTEKLQNENEDEE